MLPSVSGLNEPERFIKDEGSNVIKNFLFVTLNSATPLGIVDSVGLPLGGYYYHLLEV